jgi:hypothetical protein
MTHPAWVESERGARLAIESNALVAALRRALVHSGWTITGKALRSSMRQPDVLATGPDGRVALIDTKVGDGEAHFALIAQLDKLAHELKLQKEQAGETIDPQPVLVTNLEVGESVAKVAQTVGVEIVQMQERQASPDSVARDVVERLAASSRR